MRAAAAARSRSGRKRPWPATESGRARCLALLFCGLRRRLDDDLDTPVQALAHPVLGLDQRPGFAIGLAADDLGRQAAFGQCLGYGLGTAFASPSL